MIGNNESIYSVRLRKDAFDVRKRQMFGDIPNYQAADQLGTTAAVLSQLRNGHIAPTVPFIARLLREFRRPNETSAPFDEFFVVAPVAAMAEEEAA